MQQIGGGKRQGYCNNAAPQLIPARDSELVKCGDVFLDLS